MKKTQKMILMGPLKYKETISFSVDKKVYDTLVSLAEERKFQLNAVMAEFARRLALEDSVALAFISHAFKKKIEDKLEKNKDRVDYEFADTIDVETLYNMIEGK